MTERGPIIERSQMAPSMSQKRAAELRARQVLLMCDQMDKCRRSADGDASHDAMPINFTPGAVLCDKDEAADIDADTSTGRDQPPSMPLENMSSSSVLRDEAQSPISLRTPCRGSSDGSMNADDYRRALRTMQENSALKTEKLQNEMTSLQLELANATLELEQTKHALRNSERENERIRSAMDYVVAGSEKTAIQLSEENAAMMKKMHELRAERDALVLENTMLKKGGGTSNGTCIPSSSHHLKTSLSSSERGSVSESESLSAQLQRVKLKPQPVCSEDNEMEKLKEETEPIQISSVASSSLGFRATSLCE